MSLVEKYALLPEEIDRQSLSMVEAGLPDSLRLSPFERYVVCRIVRAEGDTEIAQSVRFSPGAVERGVDVIWVSNHGGRQLDHGLGTMDMLSEITEVVGDKAEIILDGGILRGSDVLKALAMGAKAVAIGKLQGWGLAADGKDGVVRVLEILEEEMRVAMGLMGVTSIGQLTKSHVCPAEATTIPHEMSAWVNMPQDRLV